MNRAKPLVGIIMGSQSDWATMKRAAEVLTELNIPHETKIVSAHRTPERLYEYAKSAKSRGLAVIIAGYTDEIVRQDVTARLAQALGVQPNVHGVVDTSPVVEMLARRNAQLDAVPGFVESLGDRSRAPT